MGNLKMFADDTKLWITLKSATDSATLQTDLDSLTAWSNRWLLKFNASKCKLMHISFLQNIIWKTMLVGK